MEIELIIIGCLYLLFSIIENYFCFIENNKFRMIFKCFPLFILFLGGVIFFPDSYYLYLPFLFYCLGDFLLLSNKKIYFVFGSSFFMIGHIIISIKLFTYVLESNLLLITIPTIAASFIFTISMSFIILRKHLKHNTFLGGIYFGGLLSNCLISLILSQCLNITSFLSLTIGYIIFISSDILVVYKHFYKRYKRDDFVIMSTYYLSVFLVNLGLYFLFFNIYPI